MFLPVRRHVHWPRGACMISLTPVVLITSLFEVLQFTHWFILGDDNTGREQEIQWMGFIHFGRFKFIIVTLATLVATYPLGYL